MRLFSYQTRYPLRPRARALPGLLALLAVLMLSAPHPQAHETTAMSPEEMTPACRTAGGWVDVASGEAYDRRVLFADLAAESSVVLLGESHDKVDHHRWQLHTLAALHGRVEELVIGFESFPRRVQPVLDDWVAGELTAEAFLKTVEWEKVWGFDPGLYMPLFQFARLHKVPMVALNVERGLVSRVGEEGWSAIAEADREGVSDPAPASEAYERRLVHVYVMQRPTAGDESGDSQAPHGPMTGTPHGGATPEDGEAALAALMADPKFRRFVEAQLTWDRAMAEALAEAKRDFPGATVAGIIGSGHVADGHGVPHQLQDLGVADAASLMPVEVGHDCQEVVGSNFADAVFTLPRAEAEPEPDRPRLGIFIADGERGVRISEVIADSVAEATGLQEDDEIVRAAGLETKTTGELIEIVQRQAPGTWLPLGVVRDGEEIEFVAKFPPRPRAEQE